MDKNIKDKVFLAGTAATVFGGLVCGIIKAIDFVKDNVHGVPEVEDTEEK